MLLPTRTFVLASAFLFATTSASANIITNTQTITASGPGTIAYTAFEVTDLPAGATTTPIELYTSGPTIDPVLYLLHYDGSGSVSSMSPSDFIAYDDDSCPNSLCGAAGLWSNALINVNLAAGLYVAAVGDYALSLNSVLSGINTGNAAFGVMTGPVKLTIAAPNATLVDPPGPSVPEPSSLALIGLALLLLPAAVRLRVKG